MKRLAQPLANSETVVSPEREDGTEDPERGLFLGSFFSM